MQAIVCGSREIMEHLIDNGVAVHRILATGGIAKKNPLLVQEYANIFHLPIAVAQVAEGPAMGSAIFAAVAAGIHPDVPTAYAHMGVKDFEFYHPDEAHYADYERIYRRNHALRRAMIALKDES